MPDASRCPSGSFDTALLLGSLYHLANEQERQLALREMPPSPPSRGRPVRGCHKPLPLGPRNGDHWTAFRRPPTSGRGSGLGWPLRRSRRICTRPLACRPRAGGRSPVLWLPPTSRSTASRGQPGPTLTPSNRDCSTAGKTPRYGALASSSKIPFSSTRARTCSVLHTPDLRAQPCMTTSPSWAHKSLRSERKQDGPVRSRGRHVQRATSSTNSAMARLKASLSSQNGQWLERGNIWRRAPGICWTMYWAILGL